MTPAEARQIQNELRNQVIAQDQFDDIKTVAESILGLSKTSPVRQLLY